MNPFDSDEEEITKPLIFWGLLLSCIWVAWIIQKGNAAYDQEAAKLAERIAISRWWHSNDPGTARFQVYLWGVMGLFIVFIVAFFIAILHVSIVRSAVDKFKQLKNKREQRSFESEMAHMDRQNDKKAELSKIAQSKQELIIRLGNIDQYVRVLELETDASKRTVALQAAHSEMTTLAAKLASGQISSEAIDAPEVQQQATETSNDLARLGLAEDRLNRDIIRMFKLGSNRIG